mgnify:FL=1
MARTVNRGALTTRRTFDGRLRLDSESTNGLSYDFNYNNKDQITSMTAPEGNWRFDYDGNGQLTDASRGQYEYSYSYDKLGNRTRASYPILTPPADSLTTSKRKPGGGLVLQASVTYTSNQLNQYGAATAQGMSKVTVSVVVLIPMSRLLSK